MTGLIQKHFIRRHLFIQAKGSLVFLSSRSRRPFHYLSSCTHKPILTPWSTALNVDQSLFVLRFRFRGKHKLIKWVSTHYHALRQRYSVFSVSPSRARRLSSFSLSLSRPPLPKESTVLSPPPESKSPWQLLGCIYLLNHCSGIALDMRGEGGRHAS